MSVHPSLKKITALLLFAAGMLCISANAFSQSKAKNNIYIRLAHTLDNKESIPLSTMLSDSLVLIAEPRDESKITHMSITFQPENGDYLGPYPVNGPKMPEAQIKMLNQFKEQKIKRVKVFVDDIMLLSKDKQTRRSTPVTFYIMN